MVYFLYIIVDTLHKGDNNNNNLIQLWRHSWCSGNSGIVVRITVESRQLFFSSKSFRPALGPSEFLRRGGQRFLSPRVKQLVCEADLLPPTSIKVKNQWSCISTLLCAFMNRTWKNLVYMDDGYAAADDDNNIWAGRKMNHAWKLITFRVSCCIYAW